MGQIAACYMRGNVFSLEFWPIKNKILLTLPSFPCYSLKYLFKNNNGIIKKNEIKVVNIKCNSVQKYHPDASPVLSACSLETSDPTDPGTGNTKSTFLKFFLRMLRMLACRIPVQIYNIVWTCVVGSNPNPLPPMAMDIQDWILK